MKLLPVLLLGVILVAGCVGQTADTGTSEAPAGPAEEISADDTSDIASELEDFGDLSSDLDTPDVDLTIP